MTAALIMLVFLAGILLFVGWAVQRSIRAEQRVLALLVENKDRYLPGRVIGSLAKVHAVYVVLHALEERGLVQSEKDLFVPLWPEQLPRYLYKITPAGIAEAAALARDRS